MSIANNLRILYKNEILNVGGNSSALSLNDYKSQTETGTSFVLNTNNILANTPIVLVAILNTNSPVTMTVSGQSALVDSLSNPFSNTQNTALGDVKYLAKYFTTATTTSAFTCTFNTQVQVSKFLLGTYWTPKYNLSYQNTVGYVDMATTERTEAGDQYLTIGPRSKTLSFSLDYIDSTDKYSFYNIMRSIGKQKPIFISLFPEDTDKEKEQMHTLYGRQTEVSSLTNYQYSIYNTAISLEEF